MRSRRICGHPRIDPVVSSDAPRDTSISVRELASFVHRSGDIHYVYDRTTKATEGIAAQKRYQKRQDPAWQREVAVSQTVQFGTLNLTVRGRADGYNQDDSVVEEFKTTRTDVARLHQHIGELHFAQLMLYAAMLARAAAEAVDDEVGSSDVRSDPEHVWRLCVIYLHPDDDSATTFDRQLDTASLQRFFRETCDAYAQWLAGHVRRVDARDAELAAAPFPFAEFRGAQRRVARTVYRTLRERENLLIEAPTGTGKTVSTVFPTLKALGASELDRVVYLTSRTTGQRAAEDTVRLVAGEGTAFSAITVSAQERVCLSPDTPCDPALCQYAEGYFDRMPAARDDLLGRGVVGRDDIEVVARRHTVCPFELSLDTARWADFVICDYNYVLDPIIKLQRIRGPEHSRIGVLVDEAHQLADRVRSMLSARLDRSLIKRAVAELKTSSAVASRELVKRLTAIDRALTKIRRDANENGPGTHADELRDGTEIEPPRPLLRAIERLLRTLNEGDDNGGAVKGEHSSRTQAIFDCVRFLYASEWYTAEDFKYVVRVEDKRVLVEMICLAPGPHIDSTLSEFQGVVRFSGTVSPMWLFQHLHGRPNDECTARTMNGFPADRLGVFVVPDVATFYRDRTRSLPDLVRLIESVLAATPGNYLVAMPSFQYLEQLKAAMPDVNVRAQSRNMSLDERDAFIAWMADADDSRVGLVVMGGLFAESVDFEPTALRGVIVVTAGLPPPSFERQLIGERHGAELGYQIAYQQPAMTRVVQAAGRVVRGKDDSGVVILVDPRFARAQFQQFFPAHWRPVEVRHREVGQEISSFWQSLEQLSVDTTTEA